jgi:uncharacterized protein (TIGR02996 family)
VPEQQLIELLAAWRELRHPRIADLIDRVSARLLERQKPLKGKSVPDRVKAVVAACATKDPLEVGRVLATDWPGTWQHALPMLEAIVTLPDDPRVARELAQQVDLTRYDTWTASKFYRPLFARLNALNDVRQLAVLEAQLPRTKTYYYQRDMRPLEEAAAAHHRKLKTPPLSAEEVKQLEVLEAPYVGMVAREKTTRRSGAELLEAIYANPDDLGARAVYGDWLTEMGDPRGELISLQLAAPTDKSRRRQGALIKKHWVKWLGPISDWFPQPPRFEAGFPVSGIVVNPSYRAPQDAFVALLPHREWCTFRSIQRSWATGDELSAAMRHPNWRSVRELSSVPADLLPALAATGARVTSLNLSWSQDFQLAPGGLKALDKLERLSMLSRQFVRLAPGLGPLTELSLAVDRDEAMPELWQRLEKMEIEQVHLTRYHGGVRLTRSGAGGPFTIARLLGSSYVNELIELLPATITSITSDDVPKVAVPAQALSKLAELFARFPRLERRELPFEAQLDRPQVPHVTLSMSGVAFFEVPMLAPLLKILTEDFGVVFDSFDARGELDLGDDPIAKLTTWVNNKRCHGVRIKRRGTKTEFALLRERDSFTTAELPLGHPPRFFAALETLIAFAQPRYLRVAVGGTQLVTIAKMTDYAAQRDELRALFKPESEGGRQTPS